MTSVLSQLSLGLLIYLILTYLSTSTSLGLALLTTAMSRSFLRQIALVGIFSISSQASGSCKGPETNQGTPHEFIDDYHFAMVSDSHRNNLLSEALRRVIVVNQSRILDVGAGSGLLSMFALELGARKVTSVEATPTMAKIAREVFQVTLFSKVF